MAYDIRNVKNITDLISYFSQNLGWDISIDDFDDIEDISYDFDAEDVGLKEESFAKISSLRQLQPLVDGQKWGIFCVEFDSNRFEISALRKILSGLIPRRRNSADHAVWCQQDLLFICNWGNDNNRTIGVAHFEDKEKGLPQIKMISCAPALEDFTQIKVFEDRLSQLAWPKNTSNIEEWRQAWSSAFTTAYRQTIQDSSTLTIQLAAEAQNIRNRILDVLDVESRNGYVHLLYNKFRDTLIHDMTEQQFADMYAQTVVYGLFSARCMDLTQDDFSAEEAVGCIPNTNPFLKSLMKECLGSQNNSKLSFDELEIGNVVELLMHTKTDEIIADFNRQTGGGREDPVIHFYENFLTAYDKMQKVQRGVYYTPQPIVSFIVRAVDSIIKDKFGFEAGLASTDTKKIRVTRKSKKKVDGYYTLVEDTEEVPAIQVLDPATGTGTFIRQVILQVYENFKLSNKGLSSLELKEAWNEYVPKHLLPRINAFELMMAPYAVAHMKLAMVLKDTGYDFQSDSRLNVFLTNTLEEPGQSNRQISLWDDPLATESVFANGVKKNPGINIVLGNPPYSCESANNIQWIQKLMEDFKKEPVTGSRLQEQNYKAINDDYIKFIRFSMELFKKSSNDIIAFINPHGFIDNPTFRGMRWELLKSFSEIYIVELHGDYRRKEVCPDGSKDENVFDIQQGVCIFIGVKSDTKDKCRVFRKDVYGLRDYKYKWLNETDFSSIEWEEITLIAPYYFFVNRHLENTEEYEKGFSVRDLFTLDVMGVATARDAIVIDSNKERLRNKFNRIADLSIPDEVIAEELFPNKIEKANLGSKKSGWSLSSARRAIDKDKIDSYIQPISYRPFDKRYVFYMPEWIDRDRYEIMQHFIRGENYGLCLIRINRDDVFTVLVSDSITDKTILSSKDNANVFPLYVYREGLLESKRANFDNTIIEKIERSLGLHYDERNNGKEYFNALDLLDYIYCILHSAKYRKKYSDLLKSEFPKIPYPTDKNEFWEYVNLGKKLRILHLMRDSCSEGIVKLQGNGENIVEKSVFADDAIYINKRQCFSPVSEEIWNSFVAGYQPLQKWMKDRKNKQLSDADIEHYCYMIEAIKKTVSVMREIDEIIKV